MEKTKRDCIRHIRAAEDLKRTGADEVSRILEEARGAAMLLKFADSALFLIGGNGRQCSMYLDSHKELPNYINDYTYINTHIYTIFLSFRGLLSMIL